MKSFLDLPTRIKLLLGFGAVILLLIAVVVVARNGVVAIIKAQNTLTEASAIFRDLLMTDANNNDARVATLMIVTVTNRAEQQKWKDLIDDASKQNNDLLRSLEQRIRTVPDMLPKFEAYKKLREEFKDVRDHQVIPGAMMGSLEEARSLTLGSQNDRYLEMRQHVLDLTGIAQGKVRDAQASAQQTAQAVIRTILAFGAAAIILGVGLAILLNKLLADPLLAISEVAGKVAAGDLRAVVPVESRGDEVGTVAEAFRKMMDSLRGINREISEGVNVLASSATQILAATSEMAASASETATAVNQTTSTVEEVRQTAGVSRQKARNVAEVAQRAAQASQAGRKAVQEAIEGMNHIRDQMGAVAESIVRLSEQSQAIGEIISTVGDLAEQSNLLAVNASIEAAKAGEHGRGFAVVAQEVKSLAAQSKQATAQVRSILGDIQKATTSAVMATEQGTKAVESGVKQSAQAGEAIGVLAHSITEAAQAATQITASSEQQFVGLDQVVMAMENIKKAASQHVTGTRQAESGARALHELGQKLKRVVEQFKT